MDPLSNRRARQNPGMDSQELTAVQQATIARRAARQRWIEAVYDAQAAGASLRQIAEVAGVSAGYLSRVLRGQRLAR
jgi:transcriptional regulator with XRE-family HTH domain